MPKYWKITNRSLNNDGQPTGGQLGSLTYWVSDKSHLGNADAWRKVTADKFKSLLKSASDNFPDLEQGENQDQHHVTIFVHGYNNGAEEVGERYENLCNQLYHGDEGLGLCICYDWPSLGSLVGYLPDRDHARRCAADLANVFGELYEWLLVKQQDAVTATHAEDERKKSKTSPCKAKISVIAHSMGNYLTQKALSTVWTRKNQPLLVSLVNQLVMVAADVDNDLFEPGSDDATDGTAVSNLTYRITSLFSGRDNVLGASAGLKHFGTRRLGRNGLAKRPPTGRDNVWDVDCSRLIDASYNGLNVHGAYFDDTDTIALMRDILKGTDRTVLEMRGLTKGDKWPPKQ